MEFADLSLGQCDDRHLGEAHPLEEPRCILLVAADAIKRLGIDKIEAASAGILHEELNPWPDKRSTRDGAIGVDLHKFMAVTLQALATEAHLIINAGRTLHVGTVPRVNGSAHKSALATW